MKKLILLAQIGTPERLTVPGVRRFLREFLSDPRVIDYPKAFWNIILYLFILPLRPKKSLEAYKRIVGSLGRFPVMTLSAYIVRQLNQNFGEKVNSNLRFDFFNYYGQRKVKRALKKFNLREFDEVLLVPYYPQNTDASCATAKDQLEVYLKKRSAEHIKIREERGFYSLKSYIDYSVENILKAHQEKNFEHIFISFHGIPKRYVIAKGEKYFEECFMTSELIAEKLKPHGITTKLVFQSVFGPEEWLTPALDKSVLEYCESDEYKPFAIYPAGFLIDCLETLDEINIELREEVEELGKNFVFVHPLNRDEDWVNSFGEYVSSVTIKPETRKEFLYTQVNDDKEVMMKHKMPEVKMKSNPLDKKTKSILKILFLTLFIDLIGFSIIFPLFPALAKHYIEVDPNNYFLNLIFNFIGNLTGPGQDMLSMNSIVLFGGILGAIYSLLQFLCSPFWGSLSDRIGRRKVLLVSLFGLAMSYLLWIFSGSFTLLILARFVGGIMAGNISTASAVVSDITDETNRSKGMAVIGISFAFGFIFGPAIGGLASLWDWSETFSGLASMGINPFSFPAAIAFVITVVNFFMVLRSFPETNKAIIEQNENSEVKPSHRTINILKLFTPSSYKGVNIISYSYFLFIFAFSGMEFTLTFLAVERFANTSLDNAYMFIFIGFVLAMVQGGFVRRKASTIGEEKVSKAGLVSIIPGLVLIAFSSNQFLLYSGLFFLAIGSAMAIPTLTSLVSFHAPSQVQGEVMGRFRSLGSLGRVFGPMLFAVLYWRLGSQLPYLIGSFFLFVPILIMFTLPARPKFE